MAAVRADLRAAAHPAFQLATGNAVLVAELLELPPVNLLRQNPQRLVSLPLVAEATQGVSHPLPAVRHMNHPSRRLSPFGSRHPRYRPIGRGFRAAWAAPSLQTGG
jgi:hypothetical protein